MTTPTDPEAEFNAIRAQIVALREADARAPIAVHLGVAQRASIAAHVGAITGQTDVGPVLSVEGLAVRSSKKADHVALVFAEGDDADPVDAPVVQVAPAAPAVDSAAPPEPLPPAVSVAVPADPQNVQIVAGDSAGSAEKV